MLSTHASTVGVAANNSWIDDTARMKTCQSDAGQTAAGEVGKRCRCSQGHLSSPEQVIVLHSDRGPR